MTSITIGIPTYNRALKLRRLLGNIQDQLDELSKPCSHEIEVLVSDNCSTDDTTRIIDDFTPRGFTVRALQQKENLGMDRNILAVLDAVRTEYVWLFSDDDIMLPGAIRRVIETVQMHAPDLVLFSFRQPPTSTKRTFDFSDSIYTTRSRGEICELVIRYPKLSIYVLKKHAISPVMRLAAPRFVGTSYFFVAMAYSTLLQSADPVVSVISEPLATCDEDYLHVRFDAETWGNLWLICLHPFVRLYSPDMVLEGRRKAYLHKIDFLYAVTRGKIRVDDRPSYDEEINFLESKAWLLEQPTSLAKFLLMKTRMYCSKKARDAVTSTLSS